MESKYPNHFVCLQKVNKNQWTIAFRRNNLSKQLFVYNAYENTYTYSEKYRDGDCYISLFLIINSSVFYDIFCSDCKYFSATGGNNSFGILIKTKPIKANEILYQTVNKNIFEDTEFVTYRCTFKGFYNSYILFDKKWNKISKAVSSNMSKSTMKSKPKHKHQSQTIKEIPYEKIKKTSIAMDAKILKNCPYFRDKICIYFNGSCNPNSIKCKNPDILLHKTKSKMRQSSFNVDNKEKTSSASSEKKYYARVVVLSHNRKCVHENHLVNDVKAIIKILTSYDDILNITVPAAYCKECNQYIILKSDYKLVKSKGIVLCQVIDRTTEHILKNKQSSFHGTESKVHSLGYNVIKQGFDYTFEQRKIILINIIENYGITQHEILSMLDTNIARKISRPSYAEAVKKWKQDREFVANYKLENIPEVIIEKIIIGRR